MSEKEKGREEKTVKGVAKENKDLKGKENQDFTVEKAELFPRILAALIDALVGWVFIFIPILGGILSVLYLLLKDALPYKFLKQEEWKNKSVGKKVMNIEVKNLDGELVDMAISAKRNIPLTIGSFVAIIPLLGWIIGPIIGLIFAVIELIFLLTDPQNRRLGDRLAATAVIKEPEQAGEERAAKEPEEILDDKKRPGPGPAS